MAKAKTKREAQELYNRLSEIMHPADDLDQSRFVATSCFFETPQKNTIFQATVEDARQAGEITRMKKFRFQLLAQWLTQTFQPCKVADVGGGKGFLAYLLQKNGWNATVIDPVSQALPDKYKDLARDQRVKISPTEKVPRMDAKFEPHHTKHFDLLVGMHAHACNVKIIDSAAERQKGFVLLPCCIIDEPILPAPGEHWLECLASYAIAKGFIIRPFRLNFSGQNIGFYSLKIDPAAALKKSGQQA